MNDDFVPTEYWEEEEEVVEEEEELWPN